MEKTYLYEAFGLVLQSEYPIAQLLTAQEGAQVDVTIRQADLSGYGLAEDHYRLNPTELILSISDVGTFRITEGKLVEIQPAESITLSNLGVYIMGSCMGAILHQRGFMPLHGSCVTDGTHSILITGESGAGKSTATVQSSYPSQKLWQDSLDHYGRPESDIHSLYFNEEREKFGVDVRRFFHKGTAPLSMVIQLIPTDDSCSIRRIDAFTAIEQLMQNTYRIFMIPKEYHQRHFQRCATLAGRIPLMLLTRQNGVSCADQLYSLIDRCLDEVSTPGPQVR